MAQDIELARGHVYTMRDLNQRTADVMREINEDGQPALITRHGRIVALITPLADAQVESAVLGAVIDAVDNSPQLVGQSPSDDVLSVADVADRLDVHVPPYPSRQID